MFQRKVRNTWEKFVSSQPSEAPEEQENEKAEQEHIPWAQTVKEGKRKEGEPQLQRGTMQQSDETGHMGSQRLAGPTLVSDGTRFRPSKTEAN